MEMSYLINNEKKFYDYHRKNWGAEPAEFNMDGIRNNNKIPEALGGDSQRMVQIIENLVGETCVHQVVFEPEEIRITITDNLRNEQVERVSKGILRILCESYE